MKRILLFTLTVLFVCNFMAYAQHGETEFQNGKTAYEQKNFKAALKHYENAAKENHAEAAYQLGLMYSQGKGMKKGDAKKAFTAYAKAAAAGHTQAMFQMGNAYDYGYGTKKDRDKAKHYYLLAAENGNVEGMLAHVRELRVSGENEEAFNWVKKAHELGSVEAAYIMGVMYMKAEGVAKNYGEAARLFKIVSQNSKDRGYYAQYNLGVIYENGDYGVTKDEKEALSWYAKSGERNYRDALTAHAKLKGKIEDRERPKIVVTPQTRTAPQKTVVTSTTKPQQNSQTQPATVSKYKSLAEKGDVDAMMQLASEYYHGINIPKNSVMAFHWVKKAAEKGDVRGMVSTGKFYYQGAVGVAKDEKEGFHWMQQAALRGDAEGMINLADFYTLGIGTDVDNEEAFKWWLKAAEIDNVEAQFILATTYYEGVGTEVNKKEAKKWLEKAAQKGHPQAIEVLAEIEKENQQILKNLEALSKVLKVGE